MNNFFTRSYFLVFPIAVVLTGVWLYIYSPTRENIALAVTILGGTVSFYYVVQKHNLEQTQAFKDLFTTFNKRYDNLNNRLNKIVREPVNKELTEQELNVLNDYFNICGEEYLYYRKGIIYKEVWRAWCKGILYFLDNERIRSFWAEEEKNNDSYYGLTTQEIRKAAQNRF